MYANYLSKSLRVHIIDILEPSHQTWAVLTLLGLLSFFVAEPAYRALKGQPSAFDAAFSAGSDAARPARKMLWSRCCPGLLSRGELPHGAKLGEGCRNAGEGSSLGVCGDGLRWEGGCSMGEASG